MVQKYIFYLVISVTSDYNFVTTEYFLLKNDKARQILTLFNLVLLYWLHHILLIRNFNTTFAAGK